MASIGEPCAAHRAALARSRRRYGLASPPSPSTTRQTGASASNSARRAAGSGLGGEPAQYGQPVDRLAADRDRAGRGRRIAGRERPGRVPTAGSSSRGPPTVGRAPGVGSSSSSQASVAAHVREARASSPAAISGRDAVERRSNARRRARYRRASARVEPPAGSAGRPAARATTRSPNAASSSANDRSSLRCSCGAEDTRGRRRAVTMRPWRSTSSAARPPSPVTVPPRHRAGAGPHRLRHVPGQPERIDPQPGPVRLRPGRRSTPSPDPRPPRPLRAAAGAGQRGLPRPDPRHRGHGRAGDARAPGLGQAPRGVRQARGALGEAPPGRGRGRRPQGSRPVPGGRRAGRGRRGGDGRGGIRARSRGRRRPPPATDAAPSTSPTDHRAVPDPAPATWPRDPEADLRAQPPHLDIDLDAAAVHGQGRRGVAGPVPGRSTTARRSRSRRASTRRSSTPATSWARRSSACASRTGRRRGTHHRLLGRPRPARDADPARPDGA